VTPVYAMIDDHEVVNDFDGQTVDPARYTAGYRAFRDYFPIVGEPADWRATTGPGDAERLYRSFHWGAAAEFFILDTRSYRSADVAQACLLGNDPDLIPALGRPEAAADLKALRAFVNYPEETDSGCLSNLDDPDRTMLGAAQLQWLQQGLSDSDALFKFVITGEPIQELFVQPYDRWEGYTAERRLLLEFIRDEQIKNVIFLTTDLHGNLINDVSPDHLGGEPAVAVEVTTGPIATGTFAAEVASALGPGQVQAFLDFARDVAGARCLEIDANSYALIEVDTTARSTTVFIKDEDGRALCQETFRPA
jgi:alkaline phosphatase D